MLLSGCLIAFAVALAPRAVLILAAIFSERWGLVWQGNWLWPVLGIIFAPYTTVMYMLAWSPGTGISGFDWFWIILGVLLDIDEPTVGTAAQRAGITEARSRAPTA